ncbi:MAG: sigma-54 dependent transcriptional regulator [Bacteroidetes bacterium]|nr:sigma-54 dependent transcriptional regulator [Bacteroidota bacterium]
MNPFRIFIVEDDEFYGEMLKHHLSKNPDYEVELYLTGKECVANLHKKPSVISLDFTLPDTTGHEVMLKIKEYDQDIPIIIVSGQEEIATAVKLLKEGAYDYLEKNEETKDRLWNSLIKIKENIGLKQEISTLKEEIGKKYKVDKAIKGKSQSIKGIFELIEKAAKSNITVSLSGETGTGKELAARAIHYNSSRSKKPFVAINVSAVPRELIESELFGHEKGSFTGANTRKLGKFEIANKGTLFLDEIAEMDINMQTKLLRVLQEREFSRVGGHDIIKIDVRLIVATNKDLSEEVHKGNLREDLYYRLLGLPIEMPPLRHRGDDIIVLAKYFLEEYAKDNKVDLPSISSEASEKLLKYPYPGNVRELKAIIELAAVLANDNIINESDISFNSAHGTSDFLIEEDTLQGYERKIIKFYLQKYNNNVLLVAKKLDIGKSTIYRMLKGNEI